MSDTHHALNAAVGLATGLGDGVVGRVPVIDKYSMAHTVYRLGVLSAGAVGLAAAGRRHPRVTAAADSAIASSLALLGSRIPAAVSGGGMQQFGYVAPAARTAAYIRPAVTGLRPFVGARQPLSVA